MKTIKKKTRNGTPADIVRLDVHDWYGHLIHRIKGKSTEKTTGIAILELVADLFGLSSQDIISLIDKNNKSYIEEIKHYPRPFSTDWK